MSWPGRGEREERKQDRRLITQKELTMTPLWITACGVATFALFEGFAFIIGSPVASHDFRAKGAAFVFRTDGCAAPATPQVAGTVHGRVGAERRSLPLKLMPLSQPGVYAVSQTWPSEGVWVVSLRGTCAGTSAGAIVPIGPNGFIRGSSSFLNRPATDSEIDAALSALFQSKTPERRR
jgi:hypothetical protein